MWVKNHFLKVTCTKNSPVQLYLFQIQSYPSLCGYWRPCIVVKGYLGPCQTSTLEFHCVQKRSFLWSVFFCIRARKNSVFGHFSRSVFHKNNKKRKAVNYFYKKAPLEMFGRATNNSLKKNNPIQSIKS